MAQRICKSFGGLRAVDEVSLTAPLGAVCAVIGPNGAGKTTLFDCLAGVTRPDSGTVHLGGVELTRLTPEQRARAGLGRTFQRLEVFGGLTVADNVRVAAEAADGGGVVELRHRRARRGAVEETVAQVLDDVGLTGYADALAATLPTGLARLVELGRALAARPRALLLDEPGSGLDSTETQRLQRLLLSLAERGLGVVLVEHDIELVFAVSTEVVVMDSGRVVARGTPGEIRESSVVRAAYLAEPPGATR